MSDFNEIQDTLNLEQEDMKRLPQMLNVLTILTYIGSAIAFLGGIYSYFTACKTADKMANTEMPEMGGMLGKFMEQSMEIMMKQCDSRLVILVATIVTAILCFAGAMMMRKLQKQGFVVYLLGELIGPLSMIVILGSSITMLFGLFVPIIFIILYASQRKYLVN